MTTTVSSRYTCPVDVPTAFAALSSKDWAVRRAAALRDGSQVVRRQERSDGGVLLVVSRELPAGVPGILERFLPQDGRAVQTDDWGPALPDGSRQGTWRADIPGAPAEVGGSMGLRPAPSGCTYVIDGRITVRVPLVGGKAEKFLCDMIGRLTAAEAEVLRDMVSGS